VLEGCAPRHPTTFSEEGKAYKEVRVGKMCKNNGSRWEGIQPAQNAAKEPAWLVGRRFPPLKGPAPRSKSTQGGDHPLKDGWESRTGLKEKTPTPNGKREKAETRKVNPRHHDARLGKIFYMCTAEELGT